MLNKKIAIVGATGAVGRVFIELLEESEYEFQEIRLVASKKSAGKKIQFKDQDIFVEDINEFNFSEVDFSFFSAGSSVAEKYAPLAKIENCTVIDNSSFFRKEEEIPLIIPEVNGNILDELVLPEIISNPNCSVTQLLIALKPIHDLYGVKRVDVATYQSVSGTGKDAIDELINQSLNFLSHKEIKKEVYNSQIAFNVLPGAVSNKLNNSYTEEEMKMTWETQKILDHSVQVTASCARVPVFYGHSEAVHVETHKEIDITQMCEAMKKFEGLEVVENNDDFYPTALENAEKQNPVFVGRIRKDLWNENRVNFWVVADNLRKGAALNSFQILERLLSK